MRAIIPAILLFGCLLYFPLSTSSAPLPDSLQSALDNAQTPDATIEAYLKVAEWAPYPDSSIIWLRKAQHMSNDCKNHSLKTDVYVKLLRAYSYSNAGDSIIKHKEAALALAETADTATRISLLNLVASFGHNPRGELAEEVAMTEEIITLIEGNPNFHRAYGLLNMNLINTLLKMGDTKRVHEIQDNLMKTADETGNLFLKFMVLCQMGDNMVNADKSEESIPFYQDALEVGREMEDSASIVKVMSSLAQAYGYVDQFEEALDLLAQVAQYHQRHNAPVEYQFTRLLIARIYGNAKKLDQSLALLDSCEVYYRKNNDTHWLGRIKLFRMSALATSEEWEAAVKVGKEAREFLEEHGGATDQKMILEDLHTAYAATGRFEEAYEAFTAFKIFADSVDMQSFDAQSDVQMQRLELQVERLKSQQLESQHAAERVKWQMLVGGLILLLLTGGLVVYGQSRFQRQAKAYQSRLEGDVLARTRALEQANMELKRTNFDLERFAYVASHDLREPIHNILNFVDLINRDKDQLPPRYQAYLGFMASSALNMHKLVKELMVFSQLKARKSQWVDVDLGQIMSEVIYEIEKKAPRPIEVEVTSLPVIRAYGPHFSMIFHRLLDNAITYNQAPVPQIKVDYVPEATHYRFRVLDNGIGIAPEYQERVFEIFARLHTREEYPGTGIALASCKRIVEFYGGEMGVESQAGKGARFYFTIARQMVDLPDATVLTPEV